MFIAALAFAGGFGLVWHMYWLAIVSLLGIFTCLIIRASGDNERVITAEEVAEIEAKTPQVKRRYA
jgi:cytochrome o ubiquinol oxidase subunit I